VKHPAEISMRATLVISLLAVGLGVAPLPGQTGSAAVERPFGTQRELAAMQQRWLRERLETFVPALLRKHGIDMWVVPMREYAEDPVFTAITAPETFAARRRTIYVFFDTCAASGRAPAASCVQRIALGGSSQGGVFEARHDVNAPATTERWGISSVPSRVSNRPVSTALPLAARRPSGPTLPDVRVGKITSNLRVYPDCL
jgi:hypothetical protein